MNPEAMGTSAESQIDPIGAQANQEECQEKIHGT